MGPDGNRIGGPDHELRRNRQNLLTGPRSCPFFGVQTAARLPPHPKTPGPLVLWDETETESEAPIMSYGPFFAVHENVRYSPPGAPAADRTHTNPTERIHRALIPHESPPGAPKPVKTAKRP